MNSKLLLSLLFMVLCFILPILAQEDEGVGEDDDEETLVVYETITEIITVPADESIEDDEYIDGEDYNQAPEEEQIEEVGNEDSGEEVAENDNVNNQNVAEDSVDDEL